MDLPPDLLLLSPAEASRRVALGLLEDSAKALERLSDPADSSALHDFRVAIRRLRSALRAWRPELEDSVRKKQRRALARIQAATSAGRDAEVGLGWLEEQSEGLRPGQLSGWTWATERLRALRQSAMAGVLDELRRDFATLHDALQEQLARMRIEVHLTRPAAPASFGRLLAVRLREHSAEFALRLRKIHSLDDRREAHAARIRLKRLRYLMLTTTQGLEPSAAALELCKALQDLLGDLNDAHVMRAMLVQALEDNARAAAPATLRRPSAAAFERRRRPREQAGLLELLRRATLRSESLYAALEKDWLSGGAATLVAAVEAVAVAVEIAARGPLEIERRFLLRGRPPLPSGTASKRIDQGWLPGTLLLERLRRERGAGAARYLRTLKFGRGIQRTEIEESTSKRVFDGLWPLTQGRRVIKRRHEVADGALLWELDEFQDRELWLAEVELPDIDTPAEPPAWLAPWIVREVTDEPGFTNFELAR